jgi:hypothetical protein
MQVMPVDDGLKGQIGVKIAETIEKSVKYGTIQSYIDLYIKGLGTYRLYGKIKGFSRFRGPGQTEDVFSRG